jgi:hypothetical protein
MIPPAHTHRRPPAPMEFLFYASACRYERRIYFRIRTFNAKMCVQPMLRKLPGGGVLRSFYFHSHIFEIVLPAPSLSYSNAAHRLFSRASFCEAVLKNNIPR